MHSSENARRPQRRRPDLNINTAGSRSLTRDPLPLTPPNRRPPVPAKSSNFKPGPVATAAAASRALRAPSHAAMRERDRGDVETFLDMITPVDSAANKENDRPPFPFEHRRPPPQRDSHDLSLPQRHARDSLMSNMLLSLDQFSMGGPTASRAPFDDPQYALTAGDDMPRTATAGSRSRGYTHGNPQGHGYSYSSDLEGADDASRISSRGRRSNSSSGFQSSLGRINSMRESLHRSSQPGTPRMVHSRGGRGSKSSSTNSIDAGYAQVLGSQRWAHGFGGRSSSFDYGHRQPVAVQQHHPPQQQQPQQHQQQQPWHIEFSNSFFNGGDEGIDDAAPTPTVPGGPRRLTTHPSMPSFKPPEPPAEPKSPRKSTDTKRMSRTTRSATVGRQAQAKFGGNRDDAPAVPAFALDSAPAPHVGYEKSKEAVHGGPNAMSQQAHAKEKPGFFRRVFGGFRDAAESPLSANGSYVSSTSVESAGARGQQHAASQTKSQSTPPSRDSHTASGHEHKTLQKKPSSFFRRRRKSVSEPEPPPPLPTSLRPPSPPPLVSPIHLPITKAEVLAAKAEPSPVTSLRRAMNPFLKNSPATTPGALTPDASTPASAPSPLTDEASAPPLREPEDKIEHAERNVRGFSPDYEPPPNATIRSVKNESRAGEPSQRHVETPTRAPPEPPNPARTGSFLNDNSDSEESPRRLPMKKSDTHLSEHDARGGRRDDRSASASPTAAKAASPADPSAAKGHRRAADSTDDELLGARLALPIEGALSPRSDTTALSDATAQQSAPSSSAGGAAGRSEPSVGATERGEEEKPIDEPEFVVGDPTEDDWQKARKIYDGNEDFIQKEKAAAWMGEEGLVRQRTLRAYMSLYDFKNQSVVAALRQVCGRLVLRAETQQVDRILVAFAHRWCVCNASHGFKSSGEFLQFGRIKLLLTMFRRRPHHVLFHHAPEHRPPPRRHRAEDDQDAIHQEHHVDHRPIPPRVDPRRL